MHLTIQGTRVPALGLGTWRLSGEGCVRGVEHALSLGYRHIDTAQIYGNEEQVGEGMESSSVPREDVFLVTKVDTPNFLPAQTIQSTHESLRKLRTQYVDLLLLHWPNPDVPLEQTLGALAQLQAEGSARHIGVSNFPPDLVEQAAKQVTIFCNQMEYHPYFSQAGLIEQSREMGYLFTAYSPLAKGRVLEDQTLQEIGEAHGKTPAQVALRWVLQQGLSAIPRSNNPEHREANLDIFDFELSEEQMQAIFALERGLRLVG